MINSAWEQLHRLRPWGRWPDIHFVRFVHGRYSHLHPKAATSFFEIGCGVGAQLWFLKRSGFTAHGIDGSATAVRRANEFFSHEGMIANVVQGDMAEFIPKRPVDCVVDIAALQCVPFEEMVKVVAHWRNHLKPKGRFFSIIASSGDDLSHQVSRSQIDTLFEGFSVNVGHERIDHDNDTVTGRWIIDAARLA